MPSVPPPTTTRARKRPWYLVAALLFASLSGLNATFSSYKEISYYWEPRQDAALAPKLPFVNDTGDGSIQKKLIDRLADARDAAHRRLFPLAVAELVLGSAMFVVAGRAMAGRLTARNLLLQFLAARALLAVVTYAITPDVRHTDAAALAEAMTPPAAPESDPAAQARAIADATRGYELVVTAKVTLEVFLGVLLIVALTRPNARAFFDPHGDAAPQR